MFSQYFGDKPPACLKQCDFCQAPKEVQKRIDAFVNSTLGKIPARQRNADDGDLYGGGRRGQEK